MPNTLVFPGGVVDQEDINFSKSCLRNNSENITQVSGKIASVRELFEECGLLPVIKDGKDKSSFNHFSSDCYSSDSASTCLFKFTFFRCVLSASASPYLAKWQLKLQRKNATFQEFCTQNKHQFKLDLSGTNITIFN